MIKSFIFLIVFLGTRSFLYAQVEDTISEKEVSRIIHVLAGDSLKGRGNGSPDLLKAGLFIGNEFQKYGLRPVPGFMGYYVPFRPFGGSKQAVPDRVTYNGKELSLEKFLYIHPAPGNYKEKNLADFLVVKLDSCFSNDILSTFAGDTTSLLLWTDHKRPDGSFFPEVVAAPAGGLKRNVLMVYSEEPPASLSLKGLDPFYSMVEYNVVGILPGRSRPTEVIMFSAHYDHEGIFNGRRDSILNGANDDASGTTALLSLANYFAKRNDNERTLFFCAFAGEELGLLGSAQFASYVNPDKIIAGINIEMIGVPQYGKNKIFVAGNQYSDLPDILFKGLKSNGMKIIAEPDESKQLFQRSDNYPFALKGIPYHTIMASDDDDKCYHQPCDEIYRINIPNMTRITRAIASAVKGLVNGEATPTRINPSAIEIKAVEIGK